jgi:predicted small secreted protein
MQKTLLLIFTLLLSITLLSAGDFIIGTGTSTQKKGPG